MSKVLENVTEHVLAGVVEQFAVLRVEVSGVDGVADHRHVRRRHAPVERRAPVLVTEPPVLLDVPNAVRQVPVPPGHIHLEDVPQQVDHVAREAQRTAVRAGHDVTEQLAGVTIDERRTVSQHLVQENTERPIVDRFSVSCRTVRRRPQNNTLLRIYAVYNLN